MFEAVHLRSFAELNISHLLALLQILHEMHFKVRRKGKVKEICGLKTRDHWIMTLEKFTEIKISFQEILYCSRWLGLVQHLSISTRRDHGARDKRCTSRSNSRERRRNFENRLLDLIRSFRSVQVELPQNPPQLSCTLRHCAPTLDSFHRPPRHVRQEDVAWIGGFGPKLP